MDEAKLRQTIDEARFTGTKGEKNAMKMMRISEKRLRKEGKWWYSLIDDFFQSLDTNKLRMTFSERLQISEQACEEWKKENERWLECVDDMTWDQTYYSSLTWASKTYTSLNPPSSASKANQWIIDHQRNLGWVYNSDETITYYIIRAYAVCKYEKSDYVVALCNPIKTRSCDTEVYTSHCLIVDNNWLEECNSVHLVSLYRLNVGCFAYWYGNKSFVGLSDMGINLYQFHEHPNDGLFISIKERIQSSMYLTNIIKLIGD